MVNYLLFYLNGGSEWTICYNTEDGKGNNENSWHPMNISNLSMGSHRYTTNVFTVVTKITSGDPIITTCINHSLGQLTSHHWPSFGKGENKGSVLLWYSCFDRSIFDVSDAWRITKSNQYIETLSDEAVNRCQSTDLFPPLPKLGQLASIDRENENL